MLGREPGILLNFLVIEDATPEVLYVKERVAIGNNLSFFFNLLCCDR